jgi:putative colanic acid biosynthesis glycosyltransferase
MVKTEPLFSVVTVSFNDLDNLRPTVNNVIEQKRTIGDDSIEYIVIDGGSSDGTVDFIKENEKDIDRWISEPDSGPGEAFNKAIYFATGKYLVFLNAGDLYAENDTLRKMRDIILENRHPDFLYGDGLDKLEDGRLFLKKARHHNWLLYGMFARTPTMFFKKEILDKHSLLYGNPKYVIADDYAFVVQFLDKSETAVKVDFPICIFALGGREHQMAIIGLKDQWRIRRDIMKFNIFKRSAISLVHVFMLVIRHYAFPLYRLLRYKNV